MPLLSSSESLCTKKGNLQLGKKEPEKHRKSELPGTLRVDLSNPYLAEM